MSDDPHHIDQDWSHLHPRFREALQVLFAECAREGLTLKLYEGFRSNVRQSWLYAQGRRGAPGYHPGPIVTAMRVPQWHGAGLAADCYPVRAGQMVFEFSPHELHVYRDRFEAHGLVQTAFQGDLGHVQMRCAEAGREGALKWVQRGFRD